MSNHPTPTLAVGLRHSERLTVEPRYTVPQVETTWPGFTDMPAVFATAMLIAFVEETCIRGLRPYLTSEQRTVGIHVDVSHVAPTPIGLHVTAEVELIEIQGKTLTFKVRCVDEDGVIGAGTHRRAIVDVGRFQQRLREKMLKYEG